MTNDSVTITLNSTNVETSNGWIHGIRYGSFISITFYIYIKVNLGNFTWNDIFTANKASAHSVKNIVMSQSNGKAHVIETGTAGLSQLAIKGEGFTADWIWGQVIYPTNVK